MATLPSLNDAVRLRPRRTSTVVLLLVAALVLIGALGLIYTTAQQVQRVVVAARPIAAGQQIAADDVTLWEMRLQSSSPLTAFTTIDLVVGQYATHALAPGYLVQPGMVEAAPPIQPIYPSGKMLGKDKVPVAFSIANLGPVTERDLINLVYLDQSGDPTLCRNLSAATVADAPPPAVAPSAPARAVATRAYACRFLSGVPILWVTNGVAYLELSPYQALAVNALAAGGLQLRGEVYGRTSDPLPDLDRLDAGQVTGTALRATGVFSTTTTTPGPVNAAPLGQSAPLGGAEPLGPTAGPLRPQPTAVQP